MRQHLSIGEFAGVTHLSVKTLRRYHELGLLAPAAIDGATGYRYYSTAQIPSAQVVHRLRELDVPLAEVKVILGTDDPVERAERISLHLERLESDLLRTHAAVVSLRRLLKPELEDLHVELKTLPLRSVGAVSATVALQDVGPWFTAATAELDAALPHEIRTGPLGGQYDNALFAEGSGVMTVFRPIREPHRSGRVQTIDLPPVELAATVHLGPHDDIDVTYGRLGAWVTEHTLVVDGPIHETYLSWPDDTGSSTLRRTEIGWPIFRLAPH
jgi:DNA-binding transcriptional MerR regulator